MTLTLGPSPVAAPPGWDHDCRCAGCYRPATGRRPHFAMAAPFPDDLVGWEAYAARCQGENGEIARERLLALGWVACSSCNGLGRWEPQGEPARGRRVDALALDDEEPAPAVRDGLVHCVACDGSGLVDPPRPTVAAPRYVDPNDPVERLLRGLARPLLPTN